MIVTVFDVEAGGLDKYKSDILSFAYVTYDDIQRRIVDYDVLYFYWPGIQNSPGAYEVNKLDMEFLRNNCHDVQANFDKMYKALSRTVLVGYNSKNYDLDLINSNALRHKGLRPVPDGHIDLLQVYRPVYGKRVKLTKVLEDLPQLHPLRDYFYSQSFGKEGNFENRAHDAAYDVISTLIAYVQAKGEGYL